MKHLKNYLRKNSNYLEQYGDEYNSYEKNVYSYLDEYQMKQNKALEDLNSALRNLEDHYYELTPEKQRYLVKEVKSKLRYPITELKEAIDRVKNLENRH